MSDTIYENKQYPTDQLPLSSTFLLTKSTPTLLQANKPITTSTPISASKTASTFQQQYISNTIFITTLRKQSTKIQQMLSYIDKLKIELSIKDKLIQELKRRQNQCKIDLIKRQQILKEQNYNLLEIQRIKYRQLQAIKEEIQKQLHFIKQENCNGFATSKQAQKIKQLYQLEIHTLNQDLQNMKMQLDKWKQKYNNCRQQCNILHIQLANEQKLTKQINYSISQQENKLTHYNSLHQKQVQHLKAQLNTLNATVYALTQKNVKLEDHISLLQKELDMKISKYQDEFQYITARMVKVEEESNIWRLRYRQLQGMVDYVGKVRQGMRMEIKTKQFGDKLDHQIDKALAVIKQQYQGCSQDYRLSSQNKTVKFNKLIL